MKSKLTLVSLDNNYIYNYIQTWKGLHKIKNQGLKAISIYREFERRGFECSCVTQQNIDSIKDGLVLIKGGFYFKQQQDSLIKLGKLGSTHPVRLLTIDEDDLRIDFRKLFMYHPETIKNFGILTNQFYPMYYVNRDYPEAEFRYVLQSSYANLEWINLVQDPGASFDFCYVGDRKSRRFRVLKDLGITDMENIVFVGAKWNEYPVYAYREFTYPIDLLNMFRLGAFQIHITDHRWHHFHYMTPRVAQSIYASRLVMIHESQIATTPDLPVDDRFVWKTLKELKEKVKSISRYHTYHKLLDFQREHYLGEYFKESVSSVVNRIIEEELKCDIS